MNTLIVGKAITGFGAFVLDFFAAVAATAIIAF